MRIDQQKIFLHGRRQLHKILSETIQPRDHHQRQQLSTYRRRDTGVMHRLKRGEADFIADNTGVVPYNPWLSLKYDSDARYVSAPEGCWRIFKFALSDRSHAISRLAVHLPLEQAVFFQPGNKQQAVVNAASRDLANCLLQVES